MATQKFFFVVFDTKSIVIKKHIVYRPHFLPTYCFFMSFLNHTHLCRHVIATMETCDKITLLCNVIIYMVTMIIHDITIHNCNNTTSYFFRINDQLANHYLHRQNHVGNSLDSIYLLFHTQCWCK